MTIKKKVIIVGGGTAGLVIANNLQENFDVIVLEKSQHRRYPLKYFPPLLIGLLFRKNHDKYIRKRNFELSDGRNIPFFESNVLGGASVINGCVHMLGSEAQWSSILKKFDSNYSELIKSYNKLYSLNPKIKNKISLSMSYQNDIDNLFIQTLNNFGIMLGDSNYSNNESCGPILNTVRSFFRTSVMTIIKKKYFSCSRGEKVEELIFSGSKVVGVKTNLRKIDSHYVILSGGVIGTCDLLLNNTNNLLKNLELGESIQDHINLRVNVLTKKNFGSLNEISNSFNKKLLLLLKHFFGISTLMKGTGATSSVHLDLDKDGKIDTRIQIVQFSETGRHGSDGKFFSTNKPGFSLSITTINPYSRGYINKKESTNIVNPMYLSSKKDIDLLKIALEFCLKILHSNPMSEHILKIEDEKTIIKDPSKYILNNIFSGHHLIGGTQKAINSKFEFKTTKRLYVCDASIFDRYAASNIHSSVVLIADVFSNKFITNNKGEI
jgi:choline dehydrogenase-like flavoprotein